MRARVDSGGRPVATAADACPEITGRTGLAVLLGDPVARSLSPTIHNAAFQALGLDAVYLACRVAPAGLGGGRRRARGARGHRRECHDPPQADRTRTRRHGDRHGARASALPTRSSAPTAGGGRTTPTWQAFSRSARRAPPPGRGAHRRRARGGWSRARRRLRGADGAPAGPRGRGVPARRARRRAGGRPPPVRER